MSRNQAEELVAALRRAMTPDDGLPTGVGGDIIRALRTELEPFIRLASVPYCEYMDEKAAAIYCSTPVATLQRAVCPPRLGQVHGSQKGQDV